MANTNSKFAVQGDVENLPCGHNTDKFKQQGHRVFHHGKEVEDNDKQFPILYQGIPDPARHSS